MNGSPSIKPMEKESYNYHTLPNGIRLIHKQVSSPICHVGLVVNTGTRDERKEEKRHGPFY
jgi:predicted Zn-dependent peptidase